MRKTMDSRRGLASPLSSTHRKHSAGTWRGSRGARLVELLESRRLMCLTPAGQPTYHFDTIDHTNGGPVNVPDNLPGFVPTKEKPVVSGAREVAGSADIVWTNRGTVGDNFAATFGTSAETARNVVDAVILDYEKLISDFKYALPTQTFALTLRMNTTLGSGFGASASLTGSTGGKPSAGSITMGTGNTSTTDPFKGWFIDTTPNESSEFLGSIQNAFTAGAGTGSPALSKGDFYTVVCAELAHSLGLFNSLSGWTNRTTNTGIADTAEGGGVGTFYTFEGPSVKHLMTSNNGGGGGQSFNEAIHSAGPISITFNAETWTGTNDIGNAVYEFSTRYRPNHVFGLMFKDAYDYGTINPATNGSFYAHLGSTGVLTVRGINSSDDVIDINLSGGVATVSVDIGNDAAGSGALPGPGNLPAWVSSFPVGSINTISIDAGSGNDIVRINQAALPTTVLGGVGNDTIFVGGNDLESNITASVNIDAGTGTDQIEFESRNDASGATLNLNASSLTKGTLGTISFTGQESIAIFGSGQIDTINVNASLTAIPVTVSAGDGDDNVTVGNGSIDANLLGDNLTVLGGLGNDNLFLNDATDTGLDVSSFSTAGTSSTFRKTNIGTITFDTETAMLQSSTVGTSITVNNTLTALTINASGGDDTIVVLGNPVGSPVVVDGDVGIDSVRVGVGAVARFNLAQDLSLMDIDAGGQIQLNTGAILVQTTDVEIDGVLDVADGYLIDRGPKPIDYINGRLAAGYNAAAWNGTTAAIASRVAASAAVGNDAVGCSTAGTAGRTTFAGSAVAAGDKLATYTLAGDADLNRLVDFEDLLRLAQFYGLTSGAIWSSADYNFDGQCEFEDLLKLSQGYGQSLFVAPAARAAAAPSAARGTTTNRRRATEPVLS